MEIHQRIYDSIHSIQPDLMTAFEDINRGIDFGERDKVRAAIGLGYVKDLLNVIKQVEGIRLEYDLNLQIELESDLQQLTVAFGEMEGYLQSPDVDQRDKARIFKTFAFQKLREIEKWAGGSRGKA